MGTMARLAGLQIRSGACADCVHGPTRVGWEHRCQEQGLRWIWPKAPGRPDHARPRPPTAHLEFLISSTCLGVKAKMHGLS